MSSNKPGLGDKVFVQVDPRMNNGADVAPATVVRVLDGDENRVNVRAHMDGDADVLMRNVPVLTAAEAKKDDAPAKHARLRA